MKCDKHLCEYGFDQDWDMCGHEQNGDCLKKIKIYKDLKEENAKLKEKNGKLLEACRTALIYIHSTDVTCKTSKNMVVAELEQAIKEGEL